MKPVAKWEILVMNAALYLQSINHEHFTIVLIFAVKGWNNIQSKILNIHIKVKINQGGNFYDL
jgi:hypothetical protein